MPTKYTGRVVLTLFILLLALICIFPPASLFERGLSFQDRLNLKPGIDMVGGISLIYKITPPTGEGTRGGSNVVNLAETVMEALKKRVDPDGLRNLVWRPIGGDELEIQMPHNPQSKQALQARTDYTAAQESIQTLNVSQTEVLAALNLPPAERDARLKQLAGDNPDRQKLFATLASLATELANDRTAATQPSTTAAEKDHLYDQLDVDGQKFDDLKSQILDGNVDVASLENLLNDLASDPDKVQPQVDALIQRYADYPRGQAIVKDFIDKYKAYSLVKNQLDDASDLKELLRGSGILEFHIVAFDPSDPLYQSMLDRMKTGGAGPLPQAGDKYRWYVLDNQDDHTKMGAGAVADWNGKYYVLCLITPDASMVPASGWGLDRSFLSSDSNTGMPAVGFQFNTNGGHLFGDLSSRWAPKDGKEYQLATILDNKLITAPTLQGAIMGGSGVITGGSGGFTQTELNYLINTLNAGSLPAKLEDDPISERSISPAIGTENLMKGLIACGFGLIVVGVFLISYYYIAGIVAFFAVLLNLVLILGALAGLNATFTLPSIAGIVLTVGTAVDANVLIFERLREEQHRGLGLRMALRNSYDRAFSAIVDSNMTSMITSVCLYAFGSEEVKGFGLTLIIGILCSLFTALFVTKTVYGIMIDKFGLKHLSSFPLTFPKWDRMLKPNIDWMGLAWVFYSFSIVAITIGMIFFGWYTWQSKMLDIEFAAGTSIDFNMAVTPDHPTWTAEDVRALVAGANPDDLPSPSVISVGGVEDGAYPFEVVTPQVNSVKVKNAIMGTVGKYMKLQLPSHFTGYDLPTADAALAAKVLFPVPADLSQWPGDLRAWNNKPPDQAQDYLGGVAIQLTDLNPPLKPSEIRARIDRDRPKTPNEQNLATLTVISPSGDDSPTANAMVLIGNPALAYSADQEAGWLQGLATPAWSLVAGAVNHEPSLVGVNSFDKSVAGAACDAAILALTLSIVVIMAYIWFRFGNLKYGTATVVALLHDTVFTLAAMGFAHLLAGSAIGNVLELEPFRINLTVVAGILTIMGYSMIDTIVVFDRIRENRGKYGHLSRKVVNDAINQTLSRTLLTAGTTTITVAFMYFLGGPGIHGFTFVLLVGILVGTYSSVAIAAPLLLIGKDVAQDEPVRRAPGELSSAT